MFGYLQHVSKQSISPYEFPIRVLFGSDELSISVVLDSPLSHNT